MAEKGRVTLVGAGPGDPGLMTLAGREALAEAEVVLYDSLAGPAVLAMAAPEAVLIPVGKRKGRHSLPQEDINRLLAEQAEAGKNVVRLKGGDPFLFGRGAEELELLRERGIPFRVVPGVTSALAAPAYAGIPVTHRDYASSLHIVTGHGRDGTPPEIEYRALAALKGTLVFLMAFSALEEICGNLVAAGMPASTPAAVIENGTLPEQRVTAATVEALPARAREAGLAAPAVVVVGKVCALAERSSWLSFLPLWGRRVLSVGGLSTSERLAAGLRRLGCGVDELPCLRPEPLSLSDHFWRGVPDYDWVALTSPYGAGLFFDGLLRHGLDARSLARTRFAAVGRQTAAAMAKRGVAADYVPEAYNAASLGRGLAERLRDGGRLLLYRARDGSADLVDQLAADGVAYDEAAAYRTGTAVPDAAGLLERLRDGVYDAVTLTSASAVRAFAGCAEGETLERLEAVCIGPATAKAAREEGMRVTAAAEATLDGVVAAVLGRWGACAGKDIFYNEGLTGDSTPTTGEETKT